MQIVARLLREGKVMAEEPLFYTGEQSTYEGELPLIAGGQLELQVLAMDATNANFGLVRHELMVLR